MLVEHKYVVTLLVQLFVLGFGTFTTTALVTIP